MVEIYLFNNLFENFLYRRKNYYLLSVKYIKLENLF